MAKVSGSDHRTDDTFTPKPGPKPFAPEPVKEKPAEETTTSEAAAPAAPVVAEAAPPKAEGALRYTGRMDARIFRKSDLAALGAESRRDLVWSKDNNFQIPLSDLGPDVVAALIKTNEFVTV